MILQPEALSDLSIWSTNITKEAGIPTMANLAFGTPDLKAFLEKLDAYNALMKSACNGIGDGRSMIVRFVWRRCWNSVSVGDLILHGMLSEKA